MRTRTQLLYKYLFDRILGIILTVFLFPIFAFIALAIKLNDGDPVFFRQKRLGLYGSPFVIWKFRTMNDKKDRSGRLLPDEQRLTSIGKIIRSMSIDELPELFNVIKGDMSIIGPRPLLMQYLDRYTHEQARRHEVKPGITGWAQVNGRNAITWGDKFKLDLWYVDHQSFKLDLKIIGLTVWKILKREGINEPGQATMQEFMGSNPRKS
jgi:sugar transferase EpsL